MKPNGHHSVPPTVPILSGGTSHIWILARASDVAALTLTEGQLFVVLQSNNTPAIVSSFKPGTYDVDGIDFDDGIFPVAILSMTKEDSEKFKTLPVEVVNNFLSKLRLALAMNAKMFGGFEQWYEVDGKRTKFRIAGFPLPQPVLIKGDS